MPWNARMLSGGLGPTEDDLTKETVAKVCGKNLSVDDHSMERIAEFFAVRDIQPTDNNWKQAMVPEGAKVLDNDNGTAPGIILETDRNRIVLLPGPPAELIPMFEQQVFPYLEGLTPGIICSQTVKICGVPESQVEDTLKDLIAEQTNPTIATYAKTGEVMLRLTAKGDSPAACEERMAPLLEQMRGRLGAYLYGIDVSGLEETVLHLLHRHGKTFSAAESCTGGLIAKRITDLPGASCVFRGGVVSYTNEVKASVLGVPQETLDRYGAVSEPVARAMAEGVRRITGSDLSVATTGLAGPDGDDRGNPVGTVFVALSTPERTVVRHMNCGSGRDRVRMLASHCAFDLLRRELEHLPIEGE